MVTEWPDVAAVRVAACLGPATTKGAIHLGWMAGRGAGAAVARTQMDGLGELCSVITGLCAAGSVAHLAPLLCNVLIAFTKSKDKALRDFTVPTAGDVLIRRAIEVGTVAEGCWSRCGAGAAALSLS